MGRWLAPLVMLGAASGCDLVFGLSLPTPDPSCAQDEQCAAGGLQGTCDCGVCSYADSVCPQTNRRWIANAPGSYAGTCVPALEQIDARVYHTCATMNDGTGWCWGGNNEGQLGPLQPQGIGSSSPIRVARNAGVATELAELRTGAFTTCARKVEGTIECWGSNQYGQLGAGLPIGMDARSLEPVTVQTAAGPLTDVTALSVGFFHACAIVERAGAADELYCWGNNARGQLGDPQLGDPTLTLRDRAVRVFGLPAGELRGVSAGGEHTCAIVLAPGEIEANVLCWGRQWQGRLGNGVDPLPDTPQPVPQYVLYGAAAMDVPIPAIHQVAAGNRYTCAIKNPPGQVFCWGLNDQGMLGDGSTTNRPIATRVPVPDTEWNLLAADDLHTCGTSTTNTRCWGADASGEIGDGPDDGAPELAPVTVIASERMRDLTAGFRYTCALDSAREVRCWGANGNGELGLGDTVDRDAPTVVPPAAFCPAP